MQDNKVSRFSFLDQLRGFAVLLMIIFHFSYDLMLFKYVAIDFSKDLFWWCFPRVIVFLFLFSMGISLRLAHFPQVNKKKLIIRTLQIALLASMISISTYFLFPSRWVYFGTLHCIALCLILMVPFLRHPRVSFVLALLLIIPSLFGFSIPWFRMQHLSMDYIPLFPWIGVGLLGVAAHHLNLHKTKSIPGKPGRLLNFLGKHSLVIYMIHQPILFSFVYVMNYFLPVP